MLISLGDTCELPIVASTSTFTFGFWIKASSQPRTRRSDTDPHRWLTWAPSRNLCQRKQTGSDGSRVTANAMKQGDCCVGCHHWKLFSSEIVSGISLTGAEHRSRLMNLTTIPRIHMTLYKESISINRSSQENKLVSDGGSSNSTNWLTKDGRVFTYLI